MIPSAKRVMRQDPVVLAEQHLAAGRLDEAQAVCASAARKKPYAVKIDFLLGSVLLLKKHYLESEKLFKKYGVIGLPAVIFIDKNGRVLEDYTLAGFEKAKIFINRLNQVKSVNGEQQATLRQF